MEIKKTPKADLENKKSTWLLVGYVIVLSFMFIAFEWTKRDIKIDTSQAVADVVFEEEIIPITEQPEKVTTPPPVAPPPVAETLTIVEDDADVSADEDKIWLGNKITVLDVETGEELVYDIVSSIEADPMNGKISDDSPLGHAILGHQAGQTIEVEAPIGVLQYKILKVEK